MTLFAFLALALAICSLGFVLRIEPRQSQVDANSNHLVDSSLTLNQLDGNKLGHNKLGCNKLHSATSSANLLVSVCSPCVGNGAFCASLLTAGAALWCVLLLLLALWLNTSQSSAIVRSVGFILLALLALAGALHLIPGFANPLLVDAQLLTPDAIAYTLYANFDKGWAGYCLLLAIWPNQNQNQHQNQMAGAIQKAGPIQIARQTHSQHLASLYWRGFWPVWPLTVLAALGLALCLHLLQFAPKWPDFALQFIFCNLLLTCVAEEAFFPRVAATPFVSMA